MFGDKLTNANAKLTSLVALLSSTGFKFDAAAITDPKTEASALPTVAAFSAHLADKNKADIEAAEGRINQTLATVTAQLGAAQAEATAFRAGLTDAGVKLGDFVTAANAEGKTPEEKAKAAAAANAATVKTAVETKITAKAATVITKSGHPSALDVAPGGDDKPSAETEPTTKADFHATLNSFTDAGKRTTYFRKHKAKFGL